MKRIYTLLAVSALSFSMAAQDLTILHHNDTHSHIDPERSGKHDGLGGVIEQAAYIDSVRCADGKRNVLLLHAGDLAVESLLDLGLSDIPSFIKTYCVTLSEESCDEFR